MNPATTVEVILSLDNKHDLKCVTRCDRQRDGDVVQIQGLSSGVTFGSPRFAVATNALDFLTWTSDGSAKARLVLRGYQVDGD